MKDYKLKPQQGDTGDTVTFGIVGGDSLLRMPGKTGFHGGGHFGGGRPKGAKGRVISISSKRSNRLSLWDHHDKWKQAIHLCYPHGAMRYPAKMRKHVSRLTRWLSTNFPGEYWQWVTEFQFYTLDPHFHVAISHVLTPEKQAKLVRLWVKWTGCDDVQFGSKTGADNEAIARYLAKSRTKDLPAWFAEHPDAFKTWGRNTPTVRNRPTVTVPREIAESAGLMGYRYTHAGVELLAKAGITVAIQAADDGAGMPIVSLETSRNTNIPLGGVNSGDCGTPVGLASDSVPRIDTKGFGGGSRLPLGGGGGTRQLVPALSTHPTNHFTNPHLPHSESELQALACPICWTRWGKFISRLPGAAVCDRCGYAFPTAPDGASGPLAGFCVTSRTSTRTINIGSP